MTFDQLTVEYRSKQQVRFSAALRRLSELEQPVAGRVVPEAEDLVLGAGRRLSAAVMFLDICGFSGWMSETETEQHLNLNILNLFFTEMVRIAEDYGGTVEKNTGDGLMAYFEDRGGTPPDEGSKRAVACALTMHYAAGAIINPVLQGAGVQEISFRIGIDHGFLTVGRLGAPRRFNSIVAIGTAANVASKILEVATAGEIIIGDSVRARLPAGWHAFMQTLPREQRLDLSRVASALSIPSLHRTMASMTVDESPAQSSEAQTHRRAVSAEAVAEAVRILKAPAAEPAAADAVMASAKPPRRQEAAERVAEFARHLHEYHREYIDVADKKAAFVFAAATGVLVYLYEQKLQLRWMRMPSLWSTGDFFYFVSMFALAVGVIAAAAVVIPRFRKSHQGFVFFRSVAEFESSTEYASSVLRESSVGLTTALLRHTYDLARIASRKYWVLGVAIWATAIGVVLGLAVLLFDGPQGGAG